MKKLVTIASVILLLIAPFTTAAEVGEWWAEVGEDPTMNAPDCPLFTTYPGGLTVDWQKKLAFSRGFSAVAGPMTLENREKIKKLAENQAIDRMISQVGLIRIDGFTKLSDLMDRDFGLRDKIFKLIKKTCRPTREKIYKTESIFEMTIEFPLTGKAGLSGTLFPEILPSFMNAAPSPTFDAQVSDLYTGLIIDASDLGVEGGICPKIYSEDGTEIYNLLKGLSKSALITAGFVDYALKTSDSSAEVLRAGTNPLTVTAKSKLKSPYNCDIVISSDDAKTILQADGASNFLRGLSVVILL